MRRAFACALLLADCATVPAAFRPYDESRVLMAWLDAGLPRGDCGSLDVRVQSYPDVASLKRDCHGADGGCTEREVVGFLGTGDVYLIRLTTGNPKRDPVWLLAHELTHVLAWCGLGNSDSGHSDHRLWSHYDEARQAWVAAFEGRAHDVLVKGTP